MNHDELAAELERTNRGASERLHNPRDAAGAAARQSAALPDLLQGAEARLEQTCREINAPYQPTRSEW